MLAGFLLGIVHDRRLMREAQADLAIRWFIGCALHERLPDHSSPARIRQRGGGARFRRIFERTVSACVEAGIAQGEVVHVDATPARADAGCPLRDDCVSGSRSRKAVEIGADYPALLRARRRRLRWSEEDRRSCRCHRWRSEGFLYLSWHLTAR